MIKAQLFLFFVGTVFVNEVCCSNELQFSSLIDDAEKALDELRVAGIGGLNIAAISYANMSDQVIATALATKSSGYHKTESINQNIQTIADDLADCVNKVSNTTLEYLYEQRSSVIVGVLVKLFAEESRIVLCQDDVCLTTVIADLQNDIDTVVDQIEATVKETEVAVGTMIQDILNCKK